MERPTANPSFTCMARRVRAWKLKLYVSEDLLQSLNVHLIAVARPGMGCSDFQPNRALLDFPKDLLALVDHLMNIRRFSILAYSLGGPYGLVCAYAIPERFTKVGIVSGAALSTKPELMTNINEGMCKFLPCRARSLSSRACSCG